MYLYVSVGVACSYKSIDLVTIAEEKRNRHFLGPKVYNEGEPHLVCTNYLISTSTSVYSKILN